MEIIEESVHKRNSILESLFLHLSCLSNLHTLTFRKANSPEGHWDAMIPDGLALFIGYRLVASSSAALWSLVNLLSRLK